MPRNVRNYWIDAGIDGRSTRMSGGPQARDGGFALSIRQRDAGSIADGMVTVHGFAHDDGKLDLVIRDENGAEVYRRTTTR